MRCFGLLFMLLFIGTAAVVYYLGFSSKGGLILNPGMVSIGSMNAMTLSIRRKLKRNTDDLRGEADVEGDVSLQDYRPIDPIPSSTASIRHGPIQHGTPLMPYIPEPSPPPSQSKYGEFPNP